MSVPGRLTLLSGVFAASSVFAAGLFVKAAWVNIDFTSTEIKGAGRLSDIWRAMKAGNTIAGIDQLRDDFKAAERADDFLNARGAAKRLETGRALISAVADGSNLTLDPDLDSFYVMDAITVRLPTLEQTIFDLNGVLVGHELALTDIAVKFDRLNFAASAAESSLSAAIAHNKEGQTKAAIAPAMQSLTQDAKAVQVLAAAVMAQKAKPEQLQTALNKFSQDVDVAWRGGDIELQRLLKARHERLMRELMIELIITLGVLGTASLLAFSISQALANRLSSLIECMERLRAGDKAVSIPYLTDTNETGSIAATLEQFKQSIIANEAAARQREADKIAADAAHRKSEQEAQRRAEAIVVESFGGGMSALADGDLTYRIEREVPDAYLKLRADYNGAMEKLEAAMYAISQSAAGVRSGSADVAQASDDLSRRTEQQAATLEQTAAALDEITATVKKTAQGSAQANSVVGAAKSDAEAGGAVVKNAISAMSEIEKSATQIAQIIGVIDEISFQTNLLALNAGVEAARAGDAGRGFAVVASEVRALAQRSSDAAKEIKSLISTSSSHVQTGVKLVDQTGEALSKIVSQVNEINVLVAEISASAQEQATALGEVNAAVNQMDQVTQQNAAMVEQSSASSQSLSQEAADLGKLVARFEVRARAQPKAVKLRGRGLSAGNAALKPRLSEEWEEF